MAVLQHENRINGVLLSPELAFKEIEMRKILKHFTNQNCAARYSIKPSDLNFRLQGLNILDIIIAKSGLSFFFEKYLEGY